jgi:hypothetical protein
MGPRGETGAAASPMAAGSAAAGAFVPLHEHASEDDGSDHGMREKQRDRESVCVCDRERQRACVCV